MNHLRTHHPASPGHPIETRITRSAVIFTFFLILSLPDAVVAGTIKITESVTSEQQFVPPAAAAPEQANTPPETIRIGNNEYPVPPPWAGNRMRPPPLTFESFRQIPVRYTYNGTKLYVVAEAYEPLLALLGAAEEDGYLLQVESAYRSIGYQKRIFKRMLEEGRTFDDIVRYVAPPGYSQHMFGTAVDFYPSNWRFAEREEYQWLQDNGERFGFSETYHEHNAQRMPWEAWHWNYMGEAQAQTVDSRPLSGVQ